MFERYTEKARRVIFFARYEASQFGSPYIETEHLLLGIIREDKALGNRFLRSATATIRRQVESQTTVRESLPTSVDLPLSNESKRVLAYAAEEAERRRQRELEAERRRLQEISPSIERRVIQHEFWVTMMPFGIGQFQNGDRKLGTFLAVSQLVTGAASAGSALLIEQLRDNATGKFDDTGPGATPYKSAQRLNVVKWVGAALFYGLWVGGAIQAAINFKPEEQLPDRLLQPGQGR